VAQTYIALRVNEAELEIARQNVEIESQGLRIAEARFRYGATSERDVQQASTFLLSTQATIPVIESNIKKQRHPWPCCSASPGQDPGRP
jgi:outer membrane protein TolC